MMAGLANLELGPLINSQTIQPCVDCNEMET